MSEVSLYPSIEEMENWLVQHGFFVGNRNHRVNLDFTGKFMVVDTETLLSLTKTELSFSNAGGLDGGWCIVGDDRDDLIFQTYSCHHNG